MVQDYFDKQNEIFYDFISDLFKLKKCRTWDDVAKNVTLLSIKLTYRKFAELYPRKIDYLGELKKLKGQFTNLHYGSIKGARILEEVTRFSLYSEKIIVFHPLQNPAITNPDINPGRSPKTWLPDFLDALYFYIVIQKWVKSGIVKLIVNPYSYDMQLREKIDEKVFERFDKIDKNAMFEASKSEALMNIADSFTFGFRKNNQQEIIGHLMGMTQPKFSEESAEELADAILAQMSSQNPLYNKLNIPLYGGMIHSTKSGGPLESILMIAEHTGSHIYTPSETNWAQLKDVGVNDFWTKANHIYSKIPLPFLNNVDANFALKIREQDRLGGVRKQLKSIYDDLNSLDAVDLDQGKMKDLQDSFLEEVKMAEAEWKEIRKQADIERKHWLYTNLLVAPPVITTEFSLLPIAAASLGWLYKNESSRIAKEKLHQVKNPVSVFVDLKNQRENFFTAFKNCLL
jgi:hypothetical protein